MFRYIEQLEALNQLFQTIAEKIKAVREQGGKPPLNLFSGLDPTTRARLCSLCPALKTTYDEYEARKGDKQDYECLMTLMQTLPMCKKHPGIVQALAFNSKISEKQLEQFKDLASQDPVVLAGLLKNESELITSAEVEQLYRVKQDAFSIAALAGHDALPETLYLKVEKIAK